ncbi:MAG: hypothetical protein ACLFTQ_02165 [Candidatus Aenigmatarchaeota archaeon]
MNVDGPPEGDGSGTSGVYCGNCGEAYPLDENIDIEDGCGICSIGLEPLRVPDVIEANNGKKEEYHQKWLDKNYSQ